VLHLMGQLRPSREIAAELSLRPKAVEYHKQNIKEKLHFRSSLELRQFASQFHLVSFGGEL